MATIAADPTTEQDTSLHDRRLARRLEDPGFRKEFERNKRELVAIDALVNALDDLREERGLSKAGLARAIGKDPASVRRLLMAHGNPNLRTIVAAADAIDAEVQIVPRRRRRSGQTRKQTVSSASAAEGALPIPPRKAHSQVA